MTTGLFSVRTLSKKGIERALRGYTHSRNAFFRDAKIDTEYKTTGEDGEGGFEVKKTVFSYQVSPDASHGMKRPHAGYYPERTLTRTYDCNGRLEERTNEKLYRKTTVRFNPPGRIIGEV